MATKKKAVQVSQSAKTGKFVTKKKAARNKATTVTKTITPYQRHKQGIVKFLKRVAAGQKGERLRDFAGSVRRQAVVLLYNIGEV